MCSHNQKRLLAALAAMTVLLGAAGCAETGSDAGSSAETGTSSQAEEHSSAESSTEETGEAAPSVNTQAAALPEIDLSKWDTKTDWDDSAVTVTLDGSSITASASEGLQIAGSVLTITKGGTYVLSGTLDDGSVIVDADGQNVTLLLNGANITCSYSSAIYVYNAKSATVYVKEGTENTLSDGSTYTYKDSYSSAAEEEPNACLYAKDDLTVAGSGSLTVKGNFNNGIVSKDTLQIENVTLTVTAKNNGINGKDFLSVKKATLKVTAGGDALRSTNDTDTALGYIVIASSKLTLTAKEDGMQAQTYISIASSQMKISAGGGSSEDMPTTELCEEDLTDGLLKDMPEEPEGEAPELDEIAFAGRSNVGKSSLINA